MRKEGKLLEGNASISTHDPLRIIALLTTASKKGDANGAVGLGYVYFKGIGVEVNLTRALNYFYTKLTHHPDAGLFIGEIHMGVGDSSRQHVNLPSALQVQISTFETCVLCNIMVVSISNCLFSFFRAILFLRIWAMCWPCIS